MQPIQPQTNLCYDPCDKSNRSPILPSEVIDRFKWMNLHQVILNIAQLKSNIATDKQLIVLLEKRRDAILSGSTDEEIPRPLSVGLTKIDPLREFDESCPYFTQEELLHSPGLLETTEEEKEDATSAFLQACKDEIDTPLGSTTETPINSP